MSKVGGFFRGLWRGLDGLRRILHLVLLLLIFGFILGYLGGNLPRLPSRAALFIQPRGDIVEQRSGDPIQIAFNQASGQGEAQTLLWDLTDSIRAASKDDRVKAIVLQLDYLGSAGQPTMEEVADAMRRFRASGKKIVAYGTSFTQAQYYLAAHADEVYLDPAGEVLLQGYERYRLYYKGLLDKLAVDVHLFRVGQFKSAAEDLVRTNMSAQDREESQVYLDALWKSYKDAISTARGLDAQVIEQYTSGYIEALRSNAGDAARVALEAGLVTALKTEDEVTTRVIELVGKDDDEDHRYPLVTLADYVRVHRAEEQVRRGSSPRVGVIIASGEIRDGRQPPGTIGGVSTARLLRDARHDEDIAAVVLRVDSPGGSALASEKIYREVAAIRAAGKPVVVSMGDMAASGGYYVAAPANEIVASATTITGSIGIFAALPTFDRTLAKVGVTLDGVGTTALSGRMRVDRPLDPVLRDYLQLSIERGYELFLGHVAQGRNKSRDEANEVAQGRVWIGKDAREHGLVDTLGGYEVAVQSAARLAKLPEGYEVRRVEPELSWAEQLVLQLRVAVARLSGTVLEPAVVSVQAGMAPLAGLQEEYARFSRLISSEGPLAYCFCSVQ
jgi:protease-4